jgi:hypothetical protein
MVLLSVFIHIEQVYLTFFNALGWLLFWGLNYLVCYLSHFIDLWAFTFELLNLLFTLNSWFFKIALLPCYSSRKITALTLMSGNLLVRLDLSLRFDFLLRFSSRHRSWLSRTILIREVRVGIIQLVLIRIGWCISILSLLRWLHLLLLTVEIYLYLGFRFKIYTI